MLGRFQVHDAAAGPAGALRVPRLEVETVGERHRERVEEGPKSFDQKGRMALNYERSGLLSALP